MFKWKKKTDPYRYKFLCRNCDILFESDDPLARACPACKQNRRVELYSIIKKETNKEIR